jgi:hypothetical protein
MPLLQSALEAHGSPGAPDVQLPPKLPTAQVSALWHWSDAVHALPALPSLQTPPLPLGYVLPHRPLAQSLLALQGVPSAPSVHFPTKDIGGRAHSSPAVQSPASLQVAFLVPS